MSLIVRAHHRLGAFVLDAGFTSDGGVTALFGRSGSGKTSLVRIIAGLAKPDEGRVELQGDVLTDTQGGVFVPRHKRRFGYVFQETRLFPHLTVRQNLGYGRWFSPPGTQGESMDRVVDLLGIGRLLERRPGNLSGGEKQRVAIGRALLSAPRLLLMDEPLAALDDERKAEILPYLERLRDEMNIPIVYVSHSVGEVARLADRVVVISDGKVVSAGSAAEVLSHPSIEQAVDRRTTGAWLEGTVERFDPVHRLSTIALKSARLLVPDGEDWVGRTVRMHIPAREVMLATARPVGISALNVLPGHVLSTSFGPDNLMDVQVDCGGDIIQSRITELSCETLKLAPGKPVFAIIKTVALDNR
ncbi:MAG: molybdenum ABC transporter ATP-binding protein [Allorhizobium sp.]